MSTLLGQWALRMRTPIGSLTADMTFTRDGDTIQGAAASKNETVPLQNIRSVPVLEGGERVTWTQTITKPLTLSLDFDVIIVGDTMTGHSKAGRLPKSTVIGYRITH